MAVPVAALEPHVAEDAATWWLSRELAASPATRNLLAGACAGIAAKTVTAPLDRLKIIFQVSSEPYTLRAGARTLRHLVATQGLGSLWRGHSATLARVAPYAGLHYAAHEALEEALGRRSTGARFAAGAGAGAAATLATYPLDLLRARLAVAPHSPGGAAPRLRDGVRALALAGPRAAFRGIGPTLAGVVPYSGVTWLAYTTLADRAEGRAQRLGAGAAAGLLGQAVTYPLDVARRRMQVAATSGGGRSAVGVLRDAVAAEGAATLYKGLSINVLKTPVATAVSFACFEALKAPR